jgi:CheY-like chemotaxis protein/tetratricopeptide (TPR) repeat protein
MTSDFETILSPLVTAEGSLAEKRRRDEAAEVKQILARGITAAQAGDRSAARTHLTHAVELDRKCEIGWLWLASISEDPDELLEHLGRVLEINPRNQRALEWSAAARSMLRLRRADRLMSEASNFAASGNLAAAENLLAELVEQSPECLPAWELWAEISRESGQKRLCLERVLALDPMNEGARSVLESLEINAPHQPGAFAGIKITEDGPTQELVIPRSVIDEFGMAMSGFGPPERINLVSENNDIIEVEAVEIFSKTHSSPVNGEQLNHTVMTGRAEPGVSSINHMNVTEPTTNTDILGLNSTLDRTAAAANEPHDDFAAEFIDSGAFETLGRETAVAICPFCSGENAPYAVRCGGCSAALTLSDLELLLANRGVSVPAVSSAVAALENERLARPLHEDELVVLAIGHLNLGNQDAGFSLLKAASRENPNDVILASQVNALAIRLEELRHQQTVHDLAPKGKTILVVDDSATVRKLISGKLEKCGHEVINAADGSEAMSLLESVTPDLILLDITMPNMDGYQVCKLIRANDATKDVPVVMISGKDGFFDKVRGRMAGSTDYITKPFGPETLMKALSDYLPRDAQDDTAE